MYLEYFGLKKYPFALTPNTDFFVGLIPHIEALEVLKSALDGNEGFIKVTGEVGTGKTLICRKMINELPDNYLLVYLPNPYLTPNELRWAVALELGLTYSDTIAQQQLTLMIQQALLKAHLNSKKVVIIVDEAQALPCESLEALRLFTNLETESTKLLQVVLFGQPELDDRIQRPELRQLRQRITFSYCLRPLTEREVHGYLNYRLEVAGYRGQHLFGLKGVKRIYRASKGTPRLVNVLAHKSLLLSYGKGINYVGYRQIDGAIQDTEDTKSFHKKHWKVTLCTLGFIGLGALLGWAIL